MVGEERIRSSNDTPPTYAYENNNCFEYKSNEQVGSSIKDQIVYIGDPVEKFQRYLFEAGSKAWNTPSNLISFIFKL